MPPNTALQEPRVRPPADLSDEPPRKRQCADVCAGAAVDAAPRLPSRARQKVRKSIALAAAASVRHASVPGPVSDAVSPAGASGASALTSDSRSDFVDGSFTVPSAGACVPASDCRPECLDGLISMDAGDAHVKEPPSPPSMPDGIPPALSLTGLQRSLEFLDTASHGVRLRTVHEEQSDKGTSVAYARHVRNYCMYWDLYQGERVAEDPSWTLIPAFPVTAAKVAMFLDHEKTREKCRPGSNETIAGSNVGRSVIQQAISALESWRMSNHHLYKGIPEAQIRLRDDNRIRALESAAKHNEPKRAESSQTLKASGSSSDAYTTDELMRCSWWCLAEFSGGRYVFNGIRDRAMLLLGASTALRGEGIRMLQMSDLFLSDVCINDIQLGHMVPVLGALANNAKTNQHGRVDEHGSLRHSHVELCPVGALAMLFFAYFHVIMQPTPDFSPEYAVANYGEFGRRPWYELYVFWGERPSKQMSYDNHYDRVKLLHEKNNINLTKATHATRHFTAKTARSHGASGADVKALGRWKTSDAFPNCYDRAVPLEGMLGAAMFNARKPEQYFIARDCLEPPPELISQIFPWVEAEEAALNERERSHGRPGRDIALKGFLQLLKWFRCVLLQDAAVLFTLQPLCAIFGFVPFRSQLFHDFALKSKLLIQQANEDSRLALQHLPHQYAQSMQGFVLTTRLAQERASNRHSEQLAAVHLQISRLETRMITSSRNTRGRKGHGPPTVNAAMTPPPALVPNSDTGTHHHNSSSSMPVPMPTPTTGPSPPAAPAMAATSSSGASVSAADLDACQQQWNALTVQFGTEQLQRHCWEWVAGEFLPVYAFQPITRITEIWDEHVAGLNGFLAVRDLEEHWQARWRRNINTLRTENCRRKKVVALVRALAQKSSWSVDLALRFLQDKYETHPDLKKPRAFCEYLQKGGGRGMKDVLTVAENYS